MRVMAADMLWWATAKTTQSAIQPSVSFHSGDTEERENADHAENPPAADV